jgi:hypothetical protein
MTRVLIIQEAGRHEKNKNFRECLSMQRALQTYGVTADVWGLGHDNYHISPHWDSYDLILNLENYDTTRWVPNLSRVKAKKYLWAIDAHVKGILSYLRTADEGQYDLILQATPEFCGKNSIWFPNCYDDTLIQPLETPATYDIGFCGNINNRGEFINKLSSPENNWRFKLDEFVIGADMVAAIHSYRIHWNANIGIDINYRNFETMGCKRLLLTSYNHHYKQLGMHHGVNCCIYSNIDEMLEMTKQLLQTPSLIDRIAEQGFKLVRNRHTYRHRAGKLLQLLNY